MDEKELIYKGITFITYIKSDQLEKITQQIANQINENEKNNFPLFIGILNGAFMWMADLIRKFNFDQFEVEFCKLSSYQGEKSTGFVKQLIGLKTSIENRNVIIVEDIVDTGLTMQNLISWLQSMKPASIKIATLFLKRENMEVDIKLDYVGLEIQNKFILGYGLDFDEWGRHLSDIWVRKEDKNQ